MNTYRVILKNVDHDLTYAGIIGPQAELVVADRFVYAGTTVDFYVDHGADAERVASFQFTNVAGVVRRLLGE